MRGHAARGNAWADEAPTNLMERRASERIELAVEVSLTSESPLYHDLESD